MKIILLTIISLFLAANYCFPQKSRKPQSIQKSLSNITLNSDKPEAFITFEKVTQYTSKLNERYEVVWLRLHNNLKGSISFYYYDDSLTPTGKSGIHYILEKIPRYYEPSSRDNFEIPIGYPPSDAPDFYELKSGKSFLFGVPKPHFVKNGRIKIEIFYPWQVGRELKINRNPEHFIYFLEAEVSNAEK